MKPYVKAFIAHRSRELLRARLLEFSRAYNGRVPEPLQRLFFLSIKTARFHAAYPCLSPRDMVELVRKVLGVPFVPASLRTAEDDQEERMLLDPTAPTPWSSAPAPDAVPVSAPAPRPAGPR